MAFSFLNSQTPKEKFTLSQNYVYLANLDYYKKDYKLSTGRFKKAFEIHKAQTSYDILNAAAAAFRVGDKKFAQKMVLEAITNYAAPKEFVLTYEKYMDFKNDPILKDVEKNYDSYINKFYQNLKNPYAYFTVNKLVIEEQEVRNSQLDIMDRFEGDKASKDQLESLFHKRRDEVDINTTKTLINLTKIYGYQDSGWLILWHQRLLDYKDDKNEFWKFFRPVIN